MAEPTQLTTILDKLPWKPEPLYPAMSGGFSNPVGGGDFVHMGLLSRMSSASRRIPTWWSPARDTALRDFFITDDHLAGAVYAMQAKMTAIPFKIVARNTHIKLHMRQAEQY